MAALLALGGCGTLDAHYARTRLVGVNEPDLISCLGTPVHAVMVGTNESVLQWEYAETGASLDLSAGVYELKWGSPKNCHTIIRFKDGKSEFVHFTGNSISASDLDSACGYIVHDCVWRPEATPLPAGFNPRDAAGIKGRS
jgi:hypothetical protein